MGREIYMGKETNMSKETNTSKERAGKKLVLIDGYSILNRAFYGVPELTNGKGLHTNAIYGFLNIMFKILEEEKPEYLAVAFDVHAPTFRHEMFADYKGTRKPMPEELREQIPMMRRVLEAMGVVVKEQAGMEADDILGTLARKAEREGMEVSLVSGDRDLLQIATDRIKIRIPKTRGGKTQIEDYFADDVLAAYQVTPAQFIELKALMGDTADNIPGVPKVGEKTATALLVEYGTIDNIYEHLEEISKKSIRETLRDNRALADLSKRLAAIHTECDVELDYEAAKAEGYYTEEAYLLFKQLEFKNYLGRFERPEPAQEADSHIHASAPARELAERLKAVNGKERPGIWIYAEGERLLGLAVSFEDGEAYFCGGLEREERRGESEELAQALLQASGRVRMSFFDIKNKYPFLDQTGTEGYFDVLIGAYLLNPLKNDYDIEAIGAEYLGRTLAGYSELFGKKSISLAYEEDAGRLGELACHGAEAVRLAAAILEERLQENGMADLMREMEMPLSLVLYHMEREGICVRRDKLREYGEALGGRIRELESSIHELAGEEFNINSPRQLGDILFGKLGLPGGKKTKTGYSTAADVLEKLVGEHPIIQNILEYRTLAKLKSTYADGLDVYIGEDGRIHTNFRQTIAATGRLSSTDPNLQNIPMRMELGRQIRRVFVAGEGCVLTDADYSQIELRVLAHMSGDEELIEAYKSGKDIHRITASKVFHTPFEEVTELQRRRAKAVNFGIVYGISSFGLSQGLDITPKEAGVYIRQYFKTYPKIKEFLDRLVADGREKGYAETLFGRRRPLPELSSSNFVQRSFGERVAMNAPIQGTAADIIKIAMIRVWRALRDRGLKSRLILQIHDELVIETRWEEREEVAALLEENMREAAGLSVDLEVDLHTGETWYDAK